jgi:RNA polymerase sigma-32 factor
MIPLRSRRNDMQSFRLEYLVESEPESEAPEVRDPLRAYLHEISKYPLMTREEEQKTARRVRLEGDKGAGQKMVVANLRLVVKIALDYHNHPNLLDLVQEGNMGLMRAVGKYDPERGTRFSTYASFWIRAYMLKYLIDTWSVVKIGQGSHRSLIRRLNREKARPERSGIVPSVEVLAHSLKADTLETEEKEHRLYCGDVSLEAPQRGDGHPLAETMGSGEDIEETVIEKDHTEMLHRKLSDFKKRLGRKECFILDNRIMAEDPLTLREIGERVNMSREGVRKVQAKISKNLAKNLRWGQTRPSA